MICEIGRCSNCLTAENVRLHDRMCGECWAEAYSAVCGMCLQVIGYTTGSRGSNKCSGMRNTWLCVDCQNEMCTPEDPDEPSDSIESVD